MPDVTIVKVNPGVTVPVSGSLTNSVGTAGPNKAEDVAHATGDMGVFVLGVRAPATPIAPTSAAGDYGGVLVDDEGKLINSNQANSSQTKRSYTALTLTTDVALLASAGATLRNYITDIIVENTGAAAARFLLKDAAATVLSVTVPAGDTRSIVLATPLRPAAVNTAWNGALGAAGTMSVTLNGYAGI